MNEISDEGPILGSGWIPMIASILLLVGLFFGFKMMRNDVRLGAAIMAGAALPAAIVVSRVIRLRRALGIAKLETKDYLVPLGWSGTVTYARPLRGATVRSIEARLQCEEHVQKGTGKSHREWRQVVVDEPLAPQTAPYLEQIRVQIPLKIPAAGPATFYYTDNEITWWLRLRLEMDGCPNTRSSFKIVVVPAVVGQ
jgi:hypothetical protein